MASYGPLRLRVVKSRIEKMVPHTAGGDDIFVQIADGGFVMFDAHANVPQPCPVGGSPL
jgi:hypothetical protein